MRTAALTISAITSLGLAFILTACREETRPPTLDRPRLTPNVTFQDVTFHSSALGRDIQYRVVLPKSIVPGGKLPAIYILHGGGGDFREWSNYSEVARFAEQGLILVMPEGGSSYYTNSATIPEDRYEDYITHDLISDVEARFPVSSDRKDRVIVGISMGGFGAINLALKHAELYIFAGGMSSALDVPSRPFSIKRYGQWRSHRAIFGPAGGSVQRDNDPFVLGRSVNPASVPYLFLSCGDKEGLLPTNRNFAALLASRQFRYEFHVVPGGHDWNQWNANLTLLFQSLGAQLQRH